MRECAFTERGSRLFCHMCIDLSYSCMCFHKRIMPTAHPEKPPPRSWLLLLLRTATSPGSGLPIHICPPQPCVIQHLNAGQTNQSKINPALRDKLLRMVDT